jgi:isopentenyl-diphosphate delta-isomerase
MELVVLVNIEDKQLGVMEKQEAHLKGVLHRAISVFIFNSKAELLLQQRADGKYHSAGLWTNTCCSHPRPGEQVHDAGTRRLQEEMGLKCDLKKIFTFVYKAKLDNKITEYEFDHVFMGMTDDEPVPDPHEVGAWKYMSTAQLAKDLKRNPEQYTEWFKICFEQWNSKLFTPPKRGSIRRKDEE